MDWNSALVVFAIGNKCSEIVMNWTNYSLGTTDSSFGASSPSLFLSTSFFVFPISFIVSGDNNSSL